MSSSASPLPEQMVVAARKGELQKVVKWLRKGGHVDALFTGMVAEGRNGSTALLQVAAMHGQLAVATELLIGRADDAIDGAVDAILLECTSCFDVAPEGQIAAAEFGPLWEFLTTRLGQPGGGAPSPVLPPLSDGAFERGWAEPLPQRS